MGSMQRETFKYFCLPGIIPAIRALFMGGFSHAAWFIAFIYQSVGLLPADHPYLRSANRGQYGIRHVIAQASNNLVISIRNIDQIIVFFMILVGIILVFVQVFLVCAAFLAEQHVLAQGYTTDNLILSPTLFTDILSVNSRFGHGASGGPGQDLAFIILDRVFGLTGATSAGGGINYIYGSCISDPAVTCVNMRGNPVETPTTYPFPIHTALHDLLRFYSFGIFLVAVMVIIYFVITIVGETAIMGTPFGQRFSNAWFVPRLIMFFALLVPLNIGGANGGLNGAQFILFWTAKFGSNFATNAWGRFNETLTDTYLGATTDLIASPEIPELKGLIQFMFVAQTCKLMTEATYPDHLSQGNGIAGRGIHPYIIRESNPDNTGPDAIRAPDDFTVALAHSNNGHIHIAFGVEDVRPDKPDPFPNTADPKAYKEKKYQEQWGNVYPYCGKMIIPSTDRSEIMKEYYDIILDIWNDTFMKQYAECVIRETASGFQNQNCILFPNIDFFVSAHSTYRDRLQRNIPPLIEQKVRAGDFSVPIALRRKGWAAAGIWYNYIAQMNGEVTMAVMSVPEVTAQPSIMKTVSKAKTANNPNVPYSRLYNPITSNNMRIAYDMDKDEEIAIVLNNAHTFAGRARLERSIFDTETGSPILDAINWLFGTSGVFSMRNNTEIHPLAQLSTLGKSMMQASIRNLGYGVAGGLGKVPLTGIPKQLVGIGSSFFQSIAMATLAMSFTMYTVLPFMPFIYSFFAVGHWIKSIFEGALAMPLFAMAHIRIDGDGLPGRMAANGYFLLFEIFLRPILIIFGLLASINIFSALVVVLNDIFDLVVPNVGGFDVASDRTGAADQSVMDFMRGPIDTFMFTVMYVIIAFMFGQACFKLINLIPNNILRWMGSSVATFQEGAGDPAGDTMNMTTKGLALATKQVQGGALALL